MLPRIGKLGVALKFICPHAVIFACGVLLTLPVVIHGLPEGHDALSHVVWHTYFAQQVAMGDLYPRWLMDANAGLGTPAFFFYGPVPFYCSAMFNALLGRFLDAWHQLGLATILGLLLSGIGAFGWLKPKAGRNVALWGAVVYMALPYHLLVDLYVRAAYAEYWAMTWLPWLLLCADAMLDRRPWGVAAGAFLFALLVMTHLPATLLFSPVLIGYAMVSAGPKGRLRALVPVAGAMVLGTGLAAIYLLPALTMQKPFQMAIMSNGEYFYVNNFLFSNRATHPDFKQHLAFMGELTIWMAALFCLCAGGLLLSCRQRRHRPNLYWIAVFFCALFMMLPAGRFVWDLVPPLQRVQFPWRLHLLSSIAALFIFTQAVSAAGKQGTLGGKLFAPLVSILIILLDLAPGLLSAKPDIWHPTSYKSTRDVQTILHLGLGPEEYLPRGVDRNLPVRVPDQARTRIASGSGRVEIVQWRPRHILLKVGARTDLRLWIAQYATPHWQARLQGEQTALEIDPLPGLGLMTLGVPKGDHLLRIEMAPTIAERAGKVVSTASGAMLLALLVWGALKTRAAARLALASHRPVESHHTGPAEAWRTAH